MRESSAAGRAQALFTPDTSCLGLGVDEPLPAERAHVLLGVERPPLEEQVLGVADVRLVPARSASDVLMVREAEPDRVGDHTIPDLDPLVRLPAQVALRPQ